MPNQIELYPKVFNTAIEILSRDGKRTRWPPFFKRRTSSTINLGFFGREQVSVWITAGGNLAKAKRVVIEIQGVGELEIRRRIVGRQDVFTGQERRKHHWYDLNKKQGSLTYHGRVALYLEYINKLK